MLRLRLLSLIFKICVGPENGGGDTGINGGGNGGGNEAQDLYSRAELLYQTTSFNDFSIEAGILLRGNGAVVSRYSESQNER